MTTVLSIEKGVKGLLENLENIVNRTNKTEAAYSLHNRGIFYKYFKYRYLFIMMLPGLLYYIIFHYAPLYGIQIAFKEYMFKKGIWNSPWIGLSVFKHVFNLPTFWQVFRNTLIISLYNLIFGFPAPILLAVLLNEIRLRGFKKVVQTLSYLPHFISWVILGGLFIQFLSPSIGPVNIALKALTLPPVFFLGDPKWFRFTLVITDIWKSVGWGSIVYIAAISGIIDSQLYEAGEMDGASRIQKIIHITIPSLAPVITIMLIFAIGRIVNDNFDQIFNLYNPAVYSVGDVISTYIYRIGLGGMQYNTATAVGLFKNVIAFIMIVLANSLAKKINEYGIW
ncbi:MAG: sugar ABC transporter permease [Firmicutes bacterium]|nr:sugar ABC transporter permease [Bacillota bacterium]